MPPAHPKNKGVYVTLMFLLVVAGFILQMHWLQTARERKVSEAAPGSFSEKLGRWMLMQKGVADGATGSGAPGVETIECDRCLGTGSTLSDEGKRDLCPICLGVGSRLIRRLDPADYQCPACGGMGRMEWPDTGEVGVCPRCQGRGLIRAAAPADEPAPAETK